ncbi:MAG: zf-HC2 domain-containing protein [bacterium]
MGCKRVRDRLKPYADGELGGSRKAAVERHLAGCEPCRQALRELEGLASLMAAAAEIEPAAGLAERVLAEAGRSHRSRDRSLLRAGAPARVWYASPVGWATAGLFVAGVMAGHLLTTGLKQEGQPSPARSESSRQMVDLEIFSVTPPDSLEEVYWQTLPDLGEEAA